MRWILLASIVSASALAAGPTRTAEPAPANELRARPQPAKGKKGLHPIGFLRRLGKAESEFPLDASDPCNENLHFVDPSRAGLRS